MYYYPSIIWRLLKLVYKFLARGSSRYGLSCATNALGRVSIITLKFWERLAIIHVQILDDVDRSATRS